MRKRLGHRGGRHSGSETVRVPPTRIGPSHRTTVKETGWAARKGDILGYVRVSTTDQDVSGQEDRLRQAGAIRVFVDVTSGRRNNWVSAGLRPTGSPRRRAETARPAIPP